MAVISDERPVQTAYPSIASLPAGRALGALYESIPWRIGVIKLSHLLFPLPTSPIAAVLYFGLKAVGRRYQITTHRLRTVRGPRFTPIRDMPLDEIGRIEIAASLGQRFFKAGDLIVRDHQGLERMRIEGLVQPEMFRETILDTRDALVQTEAVQRTIAARHPAAGAVIS